MAWANDDLPLVQRGRCPLPVTLGGSRSAWRSSEIRARIESRPWRNAHLDLLQQVEYAPLRLRNLACELRHQLSQGRSMRQDLRQRFNDIP